MIKIDESSVDIFLGEAKIKRLYLGNDIVLIKAPYKQTTFLRGAGQTSSSPYINTGVIPDDTTIMEIDGRLNSGPVRFWGGSRNAIGVKQFGIANVSATVHRFDFGSVQTNSSISYVLGTREVRKLQYGAGYINDELVATFSSSLTGDYPIWLFTMNTAGSPNLQTETSLDIFGVRIWKNNEFVRDFIPCLDESNTPCMWDRITEQYFYNQGNISFSTNWVDTISLTYDLRAISSSSTSTVNLDEIVETTTAKTGSDVIWVYSAPSGEQGLIQRSSSDLSIIEPDPLDVTKWRYVGTGTANITISLEDSSETESVTTYIGASQTTSKVTGFISGTLRYNATQNVDTRIENKTPTTSKNIYSSQDHTSQAYIRNPNCWIYGISNVTCISPWNSRQGVNRAGCLLTPNCALFAKHYRVYTGDTIRFVKPDGTVVNLTVSSTSEFSNDIQLAFFASNGGITTAECAKVISPSQSSYFPNGLLNIPALTTNQQEKALIADVSEFEGNFKVSQPTNPNRLLFWEQAISGDSGSPCFIIVNNTLVCLGSLYGAGTGYAFGPSLTNNYNEINSSISSAASSLGFTNIPLQEIDLSSFSSFV